MYKDLSKDEAIFTPSEFVSSIGKARKVEVDEIKVPQHACENTKALTKIAAEVLSKS